MLMRCVSDSVQSPWTYTITEWVSPVSYSSLHIPRCLSGEHRNSRRSRFHWVADQGSFDGDHHIEIWSTRVRIFPKEAKKKKMKKRHFLCKTSRCNSSSPVGGIQGVANPAFLFLRAANATRAEKYKIEKDIFYHLKKTTGRGLYFEYLLLRFLGLRSKSWKERFPSLIKRVFGKKGLSASTSSSKLVLWIMVVVVIFAKNWKDW